MKWSLVRVIANAGGTVLANPDGTVRSLNPSSNEPPYGPYHWQTRPADARGAYELCSPGGGTVAYNPAGEPVIFGFKENVPNTGGLAAITEEPLA